MSFPRSLSSTLDQVEGRLRSRSRNPVFYVTIRISNFSSCHGTCTILVRQPKYEPNVIICCSVNHCAARTREKRKKILRHGDHAGHSDRETTHGWDRARGLTLSFLRKQESRFFPTTKGTNATNPSRKAFYSCVWCNSLFRRLRFTFLSPQPTIGFGLSTKHPVRHSGTLDPEIESVRRRCDPDMCGWYSRGENYHE